MLAEEVLMEMSGQPTSFSHTVCRTGKSFRFLPRLYVASTEMMRAGTFCCRHDSLYLWHC